MISFARKGPPSRVAHHFHIPPTTPEEKPVLGKKFCAGRAGQPVGLRRWRRDGCQERGKHDGADLMTCAFLQGFSSLCVSSATAISETAYWGDLQASWVLFCLGVVGLQGFHGQLGGVLDDFEFRIR